MSDLKPIIRKTINWKCGIDPSENRKIAEDFISRNKFIQWILKQNKDCHRV